MGSLTQLFHLFEFVRNNKWEELKKDFKKVPEDFLKPYGYENYEHLSTSYEEEHPYFETELRPVVDMAGYYGDPELVRIDKITYITKYKEEPHFSWHSSMSNKTLIQGLMYNILLAIEKIKDELYLEKKSFVVRSIDPILGMHRKLFNSDYCFFENKLRELNELKKDDLSIVNDLILINETIDYHKCSNLYENKIKSSIYLGLNKMNVCSDVIQNNIFEYLGKYGPNPMNRIDKKYAFVVEFPKLLNRINQYIHDYYILPSLTNENKKILINSRLKGYSLKNNFIEFKEENLEMIELLKQKKEECKKNVLMIEYLKNNNIFTKKTKFKKVSKILKKYPEMIFSKINVRGEIKNRKENLGSLLSLAVYKNDFKMAKMLIENDYRLVRIFLNEKKNFGFSKIFRKIWIKFFEKIILNKGTVEDINYFYKKIEKNINMKNF